MLYFLSIVFGQKTGLKQVKVKEAVARRCYGKKVFLKISQDSEENSMPEACDFIKKETLE